MTMTVLSEMGVSSGVHSFVGGHPEDGDLIGLTNGQHGHPYPVEGRVASDPGHPGVTNEGQPQYLKVATIFERAFDDRMTFLCDCHPASPHGISSQEGEESKVAHKVFVVVHSNAVADPRA